MLLLISPLSLQAGSSPDPSFWPMHPTMERLWMYSVMTGQITDFTWPDSTEESDYGDISSFDDSCVGHGGSDIFPFGILDSDIDGFEVRGGEKAVVVPCFRDISMGVQAYTPSQSQRFWPSSCEPPVRVHHIASSYVFFFKYLVQQP